MMNSDPAPPHEICPQTHRHDIEAALHIKLVMLPIGVIPAPTPPDHPLVVSPHVHKQPLSVVVTSLFTKEPTNPLWTHRGC